jgi:hypothetical protein
MIEKKNRFAFKLIAPLAKNQKMRHLLPIIAVLLILVNLSSCSKDQENLIVGTWEINFDDRLPQELPRVQWRFTADFQVIRIDLPENNIIIQSEKVGRWEFTKRNKINIREFENSLNGEWHVQTLNNRYLKLILQGERDGKPAGQLTVEFTKASQ